MLSCCSMVVAAACSAQETEHWLAMLGGAQRNCLGWCKPQRRLFALQPLKDCGCWQ